MINLRIEKAISTIKEAIKGNKRRMEYWEAGKSQDELELAEFEYRTAKQRASSNPEDLKDLETEIQKAKVEAEKSKKKLEIDAKNQEKKEKDGSDYRQSLKNKKGRIEAIAKLDHEIIDLEKELKSTQGDFNKKQIQREIDKLKGTKEDIQDLDKKSQSKKIMKSQEFDTINKLAKEMDSLRSKEESEPERRRIGFPIPGSENVSKETAKEKGKEKAEEVKKQETKADTSNKVNSTLEKKRKK
jgi:hypothetical protein